MDIKQLIYLCNLERERHFGRAAEASFVSQPTLSMRLKNLERELGLSLINRSNNFDGFTPEGERVLTWAREIVSVYQGLKLEVESLKYGVNGTLRLGVMPQCSVALPALLKAVEARYPQLDYRVSAMSADQLLEALNSHTVDGGIGFFELTSLRELHFQTALLNDRGVEAIFHPDHFPALLQHERLSLHTLASQPLCLAEPTRYFRRYLDGQLRETGVLPRVIVESASVMQLIQSAQVGLGVMVSPCGHLLPEMLHHLARRPIDIAPMGRQAALVIAEPGRASPLSQHFFDEARRHLAD
ncbi:LysR family transcriptional regulator [Pantoea dispersa]|uniref:LysR family transcriptional regulator n=1 Tax=Pantoea dispersa TaxID=59814 RepID=A0A8E1RVG5_9GAMM|nr:MULTISPECIES: LysR family transcriptional regulator [Pantoea]KTR89669.1 LysR family transcriptional regulator [Pantoea dispersa]KTS21719.1 LysR family transcriptional regulator [Pantoea dispersa]KTS64248.1 LysR family transcriptional regulator [Pantoea dispersa]KTS65451.1 LysR family transcriptional regulator [Pantoea dispersa]MBZ6391400.1 LysR family transcriptional regulator [Pantoea dispersa]